MHPHLYFTNIKGEARTGLGSGIISDRVLVSAVLISGFGLIGTVLVSELSAVPTQ